ncbi:hypothetical protein Y032_0286g1384 [Ancylostoma ceylanicum]|nr:hypothetical protein Y032_0286g1384 [Ancylostoma ceylanicum]
MSMPSSPLNHFVCFLYKLIWMQNLLIPILLVISPALACNIQWPNGTDVTFNWWQCNSGPVQFYNATPSDVNGNYEYPIHLGKPLVVSMDMLNPKNVYTNPNLLASVNLWSWGTSLGGCSWSSIPTLGLLKDLNACESGVPCPVQTGRQWLSATVDFSKFQAIINMLKDNAPYQLQLTLHDKKSGDTSCLMAQARAYIH